MFDLSEWLAFAGMWIAVILICGFVLILAFGICNDDDDSDDDFPPLLPV